MRVPLSVLSCLLVATVASATPLPSPSPTMRVRPQGARADRLVQLAHERSPTVRALLERLEAGDVIVYVDIRTDLDAQVDGCLTWMAATASRRIVRASIRPRLRDRDAVALIAHELRHAVEVLDHPEVRSATSLRDLYTRIGRSTSTSGRHFDTDDAVATGELAWNEVARPLRAPARVTGES